MSKKKQKNDFQPVKLGDWVIVDAETRPVTVIFWLIAAGASIGLNVWGASMLYDEQPARSFFVVLALGIEGLAFMVTKGIIDDWNNNHQLKAGIGAAGLAAIAIICVTFGHNALDRLSIDVREKNNTERARAERVQSRADEYFAKAKAFQDAGEDIDANAAMQKGEYQQAIADRINTEVEKRKELPVALRLLILAIAEFVKIGGRYVFATRTKKVWSKTQRVAHDKSKAAKAELEDIIAEIMRPRKGRPSKELQAAREAIAAGEMPDNVSMFRR